MTTPLPGQSHNIMLTPGQRNQKTTTRHWHHLSSGIVSLHLHLLGHLFIGRPLPLECNLQCKSMMGDNIITWIPGSENHSASYLSLPFEVCFKAARTVVFWDMFLYSFLGTHSDKLDKNSGFTWSAKSQGRRHLGNLYSLISTNNHQIYISPRRILDLFTVRKPLFHVHYKYIKLDCQNHFCSPQFLIK